ncbi:MAG: hypothetical protein R3B84_10555 [Zavarzinella sp.]
MKAEERKELEKNSLEKAILNLKTLFSGTRLYTIIGVIALIVASVLLWNYFSRERTSTQDQIFLDLENADSVEKLEKYITTHRGTTGGSVAKMHLARIRLGKEGIGQLVTNNAKQRREAFASIDQARKLLIELTSELKEDKTLLQECYRSLALAEETLVSVPSTEGGTDSWGSVDKAVEYYNAAAAVFPDLEVSKKYKERAGKLSSEKDQFIAMQKAIYTLPELPVEEKKDPPPTVNIPMPTPKDVPIPKIDDLPKVDPKGGDPKDNPAPKKDDPTPPKTPPAKDIETPAPPKK